MKVLDLFSGIGGFSLGLERVGMETVAFCEIDPYCTKVLNKHWPGVYVHPDICTLGYIRSGPDSDDWILYDKENDHSIARGPIDVICGGFPCQDISVAGKGAGIEGERSGLWSEFARLIGEVRPRFAIVENVSALLHRGLGAVLGDLAALGYDTEWHCIPASAVGAPHRRDRIWIIGYPNSDSQSTGAVNAETSELPRVVSYPNIKRSQVETKNGKLGGKRLGFNGWGSTWWESEPDVGRVAHGVPGRVDRLRALGNAVVPQIPELIGRAIMEAAK